MMDDSEKRIIEKQEAKIRKMQGDQTFQQTSLSDFFFGNG
jgi:hypothetical protein